MNVLVLGAGPAGLLAAEAARREGCRVDIVSQPDKHDRTRAHKSPLHGCQYLHAPTILEGVPGTPIRYTLVGGDAEDYREKVYGPNWTGPVSPDEYGEAGEHLAWDLRRVYDVLWNGWGNEVAAVELSPRTMYSVLDAYGPDLVLSTVPAPALCIDMENHGFASEQVWAIGQRQEDAGQDFAFPCEDNTVVCSGDFNVGWYRKARVFGVTTVEWPERMKPPLEGVVRVSKPLTSECPCWLRENNFVRLGRYGKWQKGYLSHQAWEDAQKAVRMHLRAGQQGVLW